MGYPNTAFHFAPSNLGLFHEDKINFHFTGSDSNNAMNDGKGPKGSDIHQIGIDGRSTYSWPDQHSTPKLAYDLSLLTPDDSVYLLDYQHMATGYEIRSNVKSYSNDIVNINSKSLALTSEKSKLTFSSPNQITIRELIESEVKDADQFAFELLK